LTRRRKRGAATVVEGCDLAAVERGDPSIPVDKLAAAKSSFALLDVIEKRFPQSKDKLVESNIPMSDAQTGAERAVLRIHDAINHSRNDFGAWLPKKTRDAVNKFEFDFEKARMSWAKIPLQLQEVYQELLNADKNVPVNRLYFTLSMLDIFIEEKTPEVLEFVSRTASDGKDRDNFSLIVVVAQCREIWIEYTGKAPPLVAQHDTQWLIFLEDVFKAMNLKATPERATKAWKKHLGAINRPFPENATSTKKYI
jgi:hypothetical protein